ncbi:ABC transporter substrate-binding protein [Abyssibius alkaniclasticus]|uniref:ABC transporter substrate-binding protein n=1 Tax=Abyssibius alkaniclasticus TaxID=2881234 RepID=UPI0023643D4E|nr:ABC transporter substrate-binding protein [Abyssibius alkaniclasticus]UPH71242.1 ABC transporter substrate-binding protein [Abyssibius alkaniclasticus]
MNFKKLAVMTALVAGVGAPAMAELVFPSLSYRTGPYGANGTEWADGYMDYFTLINERDGGIGGELVRMIECETAYNTEKGVECYEATRGEGSLLYQPLSTGITYQIIPRTETDQIPMLTSGYGRTSAADGATFPWVFNYPANYWNGASAAVNHARDMEGGSLEGKTIALVYHNSAYGKEPIRTLEVLAEQQGFNLTLIPVDHPGQEQASQWLQIRRERPDFVIMYGWGVMSAVAIQEAANIGFPMDRFIGIWWSGSENDVTPVGAGADGYKALTYHAVGSDFPVFDDIQTYVVDRGLAAGAGDKIGRALYNRGMYAAFLAVEAARTAQAIHGVTELTGAQMRDGLEALVITDEVMEAAGMGGFGPEFAASCENHGGPGLVAVQQWDAESQTWSLITDFEATDTEVINALIAEDAAAYAAEAGVTPGCN